MLVFGVVGFAMKALDYPLAPLVLAMVLGDRTEDAFRQSMLLSGGKLSVFVSSPLAGSIMALALVCLLVPLVTRALRHRPAQAPR
jgi:TctA family transporter